MRELLFYCRASYEADLQHELVEKLALQGQYGYGKFTKNSGFLRFIVPQCKAVSFNSLKGNDTEDDEVSNNSAQSKNLQNTAPKFVDLVFARQKMHIFEDVNFDNNDRVSEIISILKNKQAPMFDEVFVEYPDSPEGKKMAKFCKKFSVPLRNSLRASKFLRQKTPSLHATLALRLHVFFEHSKACILAISATNDSSPYALGIQRLKMPSEAPSRSTLKLEEAIQYFFKPKQEQALFVAGMRACDLGACPGGWTYQLIRRKLIVEAVDHGLIAENLMASALVEYYSQDGFLYSPQQGNVDWLVCDMIEQPTRVSELILDWLLQGKANASIFNLKLPMSKRYKVVDSILQNMRHKLCDKFGRDFILQAKHFYHNRDEVTVLVVVNSQSIQSYQALCDS